MSRRPNVQTIPLAYDSKSSYIERKCVIAQRRHAREIYRFLLEEGLVGIFSFATKRVFP